MSRSISDPVFDIGRDLQRAYDEGYKQGRYDEKVETETSLPSGEQTHALRTETHACDLISRNAALALVVKAIHGTDSEEIKDYLFGGLRKELWALPSADRPTGEWMNGRCDQCGGHAPFWPMASTYHKSKFCPDCGARMLKGEGNEND